VLTDLELTAGLIEETSKQPAVALQTQGVSENGMSTAPGGLGATYKQSFRAQMIGFVSEKIASHWWGVPPLACDRRCTSADLIFLVPRRGNRLHEVAERELIPALIDAARENALHGVSSTARRSRAKTVPGRALPAVTVPVCERAQSRAVGVARRANALAATCRTRGLRYSCTAREHRARTGKSPRRDRPKTDLSALPEAHSSSRPEHARARCRLVCAARIGARRLASTRDVWWWSAWHAPRAHRRVPLGIGTVSAREMLRRAGAREADASASAALC